MTDSWTQDELDDLDAQLRFWGLPPLDEDLRDYAEEAYNEWLMNGGDE